MEDHAALKEKLDTSLDVLGFGDEPYDEITKKRIKSSFRAKSLAYHPDRPGGDAEIFKKIVEAYEFLIDVVLLQDEDLSFMGDDIDLHDRQYLAEDVLHLVRVVASHVPATWDVSSRMDMETLPGSLYYNDGRRCAYTFPSRVPKRRIQEVSTSSEDFIHILHLFAALRPEKVFHLRIPQRAQPSKTSPIWVVWEAAGKYNSISMHLTDS